MYTMTPTKKRSLLITASVLLVGGFVYEVIDYLATSDEVSAGILREGMSYHDAR
jgi:hypothetical protein